MMLSLIVFEMWYVDHQGDIVCMIKIKKYKISTLKY